jgi:hypothetical protein
MMSCTPHKALQRGHSKCSPGTCSIRNSKRLGSASKRHSATRGCLPSPSAAVKGSSGVILLTPVPLTQNANLLIGSRTRVSKAFALESPQRGTSQGLSNAKYRHRPPARSKACSREKRNKWQGPASGGKDAVYVGFDLEQA